MAHANLLSGPNIELEIFGCFENEDDRRAEIEFAENLAFFQMNAAIGAAAARRTVAEITVVIR